MLFAGLKIFIAFEDSAGKQNMIEKSYVLTEKIAGDPSRKSDM